MPVPAGLPTWFITLATCAAGVVSQAQVAGGRAYIPIRPAIRTNDAPGGQVQKSRFATKTSGINAGASVISPDNIPPEFPMHPGTGMRTTGNNVRGTIIRTGSVPSRFSERSGFSVQTSGTNVTENVIRAGRAPSGFPQRPGFSVQSNGGDNVEGNVVRTGIGPSEFRRSQSSGAGATVVRTGSWPSGFPQRTDWSVQSNGNNLGGNFIRTGSGPSGLPQRPNSGMEGTAIHTEIEPSGFPRRPGSSTAGNFIRTGNAPNGFPQHPDSNVQISGNNIGGNVMRTGSAPNGFPQFPRSDLRTNGNNVGEHLVRKNRASSVFPQRPGFGVPNMRNDVGGTVIKTNIMLGGFPQRFGFGLDNVRNGVGAQILRDEAPLIREIETKMHEGREMERNLTAVRDAIRQEMVNSRGIGPIRRIKMSRKLGELESRIKLLHGKNEEGEQRFRAFVSGVASGEISDRQSAHTILHNIFSFYGTVVEKIIVVCRSLAGGIINFYKRMFLGIGSVIHKLLSLKLRPLQAGINMIAGI